MSHLLGGTIRHSQPPDGHRSGIEPVLLAASLQLRPNARVLEAGTGSGAALLCLAAREPTIHAVGLEIDPVRAAAARANVLANGFDRLRIEVADITLWRRSELFDHAVANPPWHDEHGTASPDPARERARRGAATMLAGWAAGLARCVRPGGTVTFIVSAASVANAIAALTAASCGSLAICPFWPKAGRPAKLVLLQSRRGGRGPTRLLPGLILHEADGRYTRAADATLREGATLPL